MKRVALLAVLVLCLVLAGCGKADEVEDVIVEKLPAALATYTPTPAPKPAPAQAAPEETPPAEADAGPITIGSTDLVTDLDPANAYAMQSWEILRNTMDTLLVYVPGSSELQPGLAESYQVSDNGLEYTFHLREGLEFPDGTPFTADAVVWSVERVLRLGGELSYLVSDFVDEVEVVDDYTVRFVLDDPNGGFPYAVTTLPYAPVSPNCYPEDDFDHDSTCGGIGPYTVVRWDPDLEIELEANPGYYGEQPAEARIIYRFIPETAELVAAFEAGHVDVAWEWENPAAYVEFYERPEYNVFEGPGAFIRYVCFNTATPPFDDPLVRRAISFAIDRVAIADGLYQGSHQPLLSMVPEGAPFHAELDTAYDLNETVQLLEAAGFGDRAPLVVDLWWTPEHYGETEADLAAMLEDMLESTGVIDVNLHSAEWGSFIQGFTSGEAPVFLLGWIADYPDPDNFFYLFGDCEASQDLGIFYCNERMDDLLHQARRSVDMDERQALYYEIQELWSEEMPTIPLTQRKLLAVAQDDVGGVVLDTNMFLRYWLLFKEWAVAEPAAAPEPAAPKVSLELREGEAVVVVEGHVSEISFDGLQKLAPQPDADGKTRVDIPDIFPSEAGEISFNFAHGGKRYRVRIGVTYSSAGSRTLRILGLSEAPAPPADTPTPTRTATPTPKRATATPTPRPPTPTATRAPSPPAAAPPAITSISFPSRIRADGSRVTGRVSFSDGDGDVNWVTFDVVNAVDFTSFSFNPLEYLEQGDGRSGTFLFNVWGKSVQEVTLRVTLYDAAGDRSAPADFTFRCE